MSNHRWEAEMDVVKVFLIGFGLLSLLWLGTCSLIGVGTAIAVNSAATSFGNEVEQAEGRYAEYREEAELEEWNDEDVTINKTTHFENHHDY
jgi:hypothetical protein